jgi:hypothetical protein
VINVSLKNFCMNFCLTSRIHRERFQKMISATSTFLCRVCYRAGPCTSHVCLNESRRAFTLILASVQGISKVTRQLEVDFAPAVVRARFVFPSHNPMNNLLVIDWI